MARPPGGGSTWVHSSDTMKLIGPGAAVWGHITAPIERSELVLAFPFSNDPWKSFYALRIAVAATGVTWEYYHPRLDAPRTLRWTPSTPAEQLVPFPEFRARKFMGEAHVADAPLVASVHATAGAVGVLDGRGEPRALFRLGSDEDPAWAGAGERGALLAGGAAMVRMFLPTGPLTRVEVVKTSLP